MAPFGVPLFDQTPTRQWRNPRGAYLNGIYYVASDTYPQAGRRGGARGVGSWADADVRLLSGPALTQLTDQGVIIPSSAVTAVNAAFIEIVPGAIFKDSSGNYSMYATLNDGFYNSNLPSQGGTYRWTAPSPTGPWAVVPGGPHIPSSGGDVTVDCGPPVFYNGQWVISFVSYAEPYTGTRHVAFATSTSDLGPWTRIANPTAEGGNGFTAIDSPHLIVDSTTNTLYLCQCADAYLNEIYQVSKDLTKGWYMNGTVQVSNAASNVESQGDNNWGGGSVFQGPDGFYHLWQGTSPANGNYWCVYGGKWIPGEPYVQLADQTFWDISNGITLTNAAQNIAIPSLAFFPETGIRALDLVVQAQETVTFTAGEQIQVDPGYNMNGFMLPLPGLNIPAQARRRLDIWQNNSNGFVFRVTPQNTPGTVKFWAGVAGYWRLP